MAPPDEEQEPSEKTNDWTNLAGYSRGEVDAVVGGVKRIAVGRGDRVQHLQEHGHVVGLPRLPSGPDERLDEKVEVLLHVLDALLVVLSTPMGMKRDKRHRVKSGLEFRLEVTAVTAV